LITNEEVLAVDQNSTGGHEALVRGNIRVWTAEIPSKSRSLCCRFQSRRRSARCEPRVERNPHSHTNRCNPRSLAKNRFKKTNRRPHNSQCSCRSLISSVSRGIERQWRIMRL
jgi:hypothetical protein